MNINEVLPALLRQGLCGKRVDSALLSSLSSERVKELYSLSKYHDVAHIVGAVLEDTGALSDPETKELFIKERMLAVFRYRRQRDDLLQITDIFESEGVEHIALKGSVLRDYYPEPWMRTSCDIDILVKREELERAAQLLTEKCGCTLSSRTSHDVSLTSPLGVNLELHFLLIEDYVLPDLQEILESVWERSSLIEGKKYARAMTDEMFYFYHIAHMAKHFVSGGCGIKPFLDLWVLENRVPSNPEKRAALIRKGGFTAFDKGVSELVGVWFGGREHSDLTRSLEKFIFCGGAYGTLENNVSVGVAKKRGRLGYVFSKVFPSYEKMKKMYPSLERKKWLLPFYHFKRWYRVLFSGGMKTAKAQILKSNTVSEEEVKAAERLLCELGLSDK